MGASIVRRSVDLGHRVVYMTPDNSQEGPHQ